MDQAAVVFDYCVCVCVATGAPEIKNMIKAGISQCVGAALTSQIPYYMLLKKHRTSFVRDAPLTLATETQ